MKTLFPRWIVSSLAIYALPSLVGGVQVESFGAALAAAAVLMLLNMLVRPVLLFLTLPLTLLTLGLFLLILNGLMFYWAGALVSGVHVETFGAAFLGAILLSLVNWAFELNVSKDGGKRIIIVRPPRAAREGDRPTRDLN